MNIEDLTKTQLLLLTILVNFVTSIATGVLTVSLLDQAPPTVIQTVNRIVDHTIEQVTTEVPVVRNVPVSGPSSEDLLTSAITEDRARSVRLYRTGSDTVLGAGLYVPSARAVFTSATNLPGTITVEFSDGTRAEARSETTSGSAERYGFAVDAVIPSAVEPHFKTPGELKEGQTVIARSASGQVVTGIITQVSATAFSTDLPSIPVGAAVVNLSGDVVGMSMPNGTLLTGNSIMGSATP